MQYSNTYAGTLPLHMRGFYDVFMAVSEEEVPFHNDIARRITTDQLGEEMIWYSGLPTAQLLRNGQTSPRAQVSTPFTKTWFTEEYGMAVEFTRKQLMTDQSGIIKQAPKQLGISHWNAFQRMVAGLLNNGTNSSYTGPDAVVLFSASHVISNGRTFSNLSTAQTLSPDAVKQMLADVKLHKTWHNEPWVERFGHRLITGTTLQMEAQEILESSLKAQEMSNTINKLKGASNAGMVTSTVGNPFIEDTNAFWLIPAGAKNPLFWLEREGVSIEHEKTIDATEIWNSLADRTVGWLHAWGTQMNAGA